MGYIIIKNIKSQYGSGDIIFNKDYSGEKVVERLVFEVILVFKQGLRLNTFLKIAPVNCSYKDKLAKSENKFMYPFLQTKKYINNGYLQEIAINEFFKNKLEDDIVKNNVCKLVHSEIIHFSNVNETNLNINYNDLSDTFQFLGEISLKQFFDKSSKQLIESVASKYGDNQFYSIMITVKDDNIVSFNHNNVPLLEDALLYLDNTIDVLIHLNVNYGFSHLDFHWGGNQKYNLLTKQPYIFDFDLSTLDENFSKFYNDVFPLLTCIFITFAEEIIISKDEPDIELAITLEDFDLQGFNDINKKDFTNIIALSLGINESQVIIQLLPRGRKVKVGTIIVQVRILKLPVNDLLKKIKKMENLLLHAGFKCTNISKPVIVTDSIDEKEIKNNHALRTTGLLYDIFWLFSSISSEFSNYPTYNHYMLSLLDNNCKIKWQKDFIVYNCSYILINSISDEEILELWLSIFEQFKIYKLQPNLDKDTIKLKLKSKVFIDNLKEPFSEKINSSLKRKIKKNNYNSNFISLLQNPLIVDTFTKHLILSIVNGIVYYTNVSDFMSRHISRTSQNKFAFSQVHIKNFVIPVLAINATAKYIDFLPLDINEKPFISNILYTSTIPKENRENIAIKDESSSLEYTFNGLQKLNVSKLKKIADDIGIKKKGVSWKLCCPPYGIKQDIIKCILELQLNTLL